MFMGFCVLDKTRRKNVLMKSYQQILAREKQILGPYFYIFRLFSEWICDIHGYIDRGKFDVSLAC